VIGMLRRTLARLEVSSRTLYALVEPRSCFAGTLAELAFAADRTYMLALDDAARAPKLALSPMNFGAYPMVNGQTRLGRRLSGDAGAIEAARGRIGESLDAREALAFGLVTATPDDIDWPDEIRIALEERAAMSPDALTGLEANLRFGGHETMQIIERVFLLQRVDIFAATASQHLARIALVTREVEVDDGAVLLHADQPADAMYVVIDGELRASARGATRSITAGEAVGALALLDDTPLALDVRAVKNSRLLRLTKRDLHDLLHDHPDLAVSLLHGMATRLRGMAT